MSHGLGAVCDEFYVSSRLFLKLETKLDNETVLHFFDRIRKEFPAVRRLRRRDGKAIMLEEEPGERGGRRWVRLDPGSIRFGETAPLEMDGVRRMGALILTQAPYHLSLNDLCYDHLEVTYGFDLAYRGNHDQLVAETLLGEHAGAGFLFGGHAASVIDAQPYFGVALTPECDLQAYVEVKSRTTTFEVRNGAYEGESISVYLTVRKYWGAGASDSLADVLHLLFDTADEFATERVVPHFVNPLAAAIASRS